MHFTNAIYSMLHVVPMEKRNAFNICHMCNTGLNYMFCKENIGFEYSSLLVCYAVYQVI